DDQRAARMKEEKQDDERDDDRFFGEASGERLNGGVDEFGAIVRCGDFDTFGQPVAEFFDAFFDAIDDFSGVFSVAHHDNSADDFAVAVFIENPAPQFGAVLNNADIGDGDGGATIVGFHDGLLDIFETFEIALSAHKIFDVALFEDFSTGISI